MADTYEFRFRRRYSLPPTDPRFLEATNEEMVLDFWAHAHLDNPKLREESVTDDYEELLAAMEAEMAGEPEGEPKPSEPEQPSAVTVEHEVVSLDPGEVPDDWETIADDRF